MQRFFLVDASTEYLSLFCYELRRRPDGLYERMAENENALFNGIDREQFFGNLNSLCITKENIKAPKLPLKPAIPAEGMGDSYSGNMIANLDAAAEKAIAEHPAEEYTIYDKIRDEAVNE